MRQRRGPWLSGLILALIGSVWMIGQVFGAAIIGRELLPDPGMAPASDQPDYSWEP